VSLTGHLRPDHGIRADRTVTFRQRLRGYARREAEDAVAQELRALA
jgi:hypothetical protein